MRALLRAVTIFVLAGGLANMAHSQPRYDRKLEEAVKEIVAAKIGDIRGGFAFGAKPAMVRVRTPNGLHGGRKTVRPESMAHAMERAEPLSD